jgi:DegV family protein with EDD domain
LVIIDTKYNVVIPIGEAELGADMKRLHIVTDSMAHIPEALCQEYDIKVVPLPYVWDGETYFDFDIGPREFYSKLRSSKKIPITSGPPPKLFKEQYETLGVDGDPILVITVAGFFSSTYKAANLAKEMASDADVTVFSSDSNSMGLGFQVLAAARAARAGKSLQDVLSIVEHVKHTSGLVFATPHIEYLLRGGRISHIQHFVASLLNLIPIMEIRNGPIKPVERIRQEKNIIPRLLDLVAERLEDEKPLRMAVVHVDAESQAWELAKEVRERFSPDELITTELTPVLGIHAGPDALGLAYSTGY